MKNFRLLFVCLLFLSVYSCRENEVILPPPVYFNYVPTNMGHTIIYNVDSTFYADFDSSVRVYNFQIMERVDITFNDLSGRPTQRIAVYKRDNPSSPWVDANTYYSTLTTSRFERVENNERFVRLGFPISSTLLWNGNAYNTIGSEDYSYDSFHEPVTIASFSFDSVLTVLQLGDINIIHEKFGIEKYANHVGRVYREYIDADKYASGVYKSGVVYKETIYSYVP